MLQSSCEGNLFLNCTITLESPPTGLENKWKLRTNAGAKTPLYYGKAPAKAVQVLHWKLFLEPLILTSNNFITIVAASVKYKTAPIDLENKGSGSCFQLGALMKTYLKAWLYSITFIE